MNAIDNVAPMRSVEEGTVFLSLEQIGDD